MHLKPRTRLKRRGLKVSKAPAVEYEDKIVGVRTSNPLQVKVPKGIDPGFEYRPGSTKGAEPSKLLLDKVLDVPPKFGARLVENLLSNATNRSLLNNEVAAMVNTVASEKVARGVMKSVGVIPTDVIDALKTRKIEPETALITLRDSDILHAIRDKKDHALPLDFLENLAEHLLKPEAVLLDNSKKTPVLIYVYSYQTAHGKAKVILGLDYTVKAHNKATGKKERIKTNVINSGKLFDWNEQIKDGFAQYEALWGAIK